MKKPYKYSFFLVFFLGLLLVSCGKLKEIIPKEEQKSISIDSYTYEVVENESSVFNELSYKLSFDASFTLGDGCSIKEFGIKIEAKKALRFTIDYSNTEAIELKHKDDLPYALLKYSVPDTENKMLSRVQIKISTTDLMEDINSFLSVSCYNEQGYEMIDEHHLTEDGSFKMQYSSTTGIFYEYDEFKESYKVVSIISKAKTLEIPAMHNQHPVTEIDVGALKAVAGVEELILSKTLISIPKGLLKEMKQLKTLTLPFMDIEEGIGYFFGTGNGFIPSSLKNVMITGGSYIGKDAFFGCKYLTSISLPESITRIEDNAFRGCSSLISLVIPKQVEEIKDNVFLNCYRLTEIYNLSKIKLYLDTVLCTHTSLDEESHLLEKDNFIFYKDEDKYSLVFYTGEEKELGLPQDIEGSSYDINQNAFKDMSTITSVTISSGVRTIGMRAFSSCTNLTKIYIAEGVEKIEDYAFEDCYLYRQVFVSSSVKEIGKGIFSDCKLQYNELDNIYYLGNKDNSHLWLIKPKNTTIEKIEISDGTTHIFRSAFSGCKQLQQLSIPESVVQIGDYAFYECESLKTISIPSCVKQIGDYAFSNCKKLTKLVIPNSVETMGQAVLIGCNMLKELTLPFVGSDRLGSLDGHFGYIFSFHDPYHSFNDHDSYRNLIPESLFKVTITGGSITSSAFYNCNTLTTIILSDSITSIGENAFYGCSKLNSITLPEQLDKIGAYAFAGCTSIENIKLPNSITDIGAFAFTGCNLKEINLPKNIDKIEEDLFSDCDDLKKVILPNGVKSIKQRAFFGCDKLEDIVIPNSVLSIGEGAFNGSSMLCIYYEGTISEWQKIEVSLYNYSIVLDRVYFYSEDKPSEAGNYWHYVDGVITKW